MVTTAEVNAMMMIDPVKDAMKNGTTTPTTMSLSSESSSEAQSRKRGNANDDSERYHINTTELHDDEISMDDHDDDDDDEFDIGFVEDLDAMSAFSSITEQIPKVHDDAATVATSASSDEFEFVRLPYKGATTRCPVQLYLTCNDDYFSQYQCQVRKLIEFFEAKPSDLQLSVQGRNRKIVLGQVGIRCRACYNQFFNPALGFTGHNHHHTPSSIYFPSKLLGIYQAGQNMASLHLLTNCPNMEPDKREELKKLYETSLKIKKPVVGKELWAHTATAVGVYEDDEDNVLRFDPCWARKIHHWLYL